MTLAEVVIKFAGGVREHALEAAETLKHSRAEMQGVYIYLFPDDTVLYIGEDAMIYDNEEYLYNDGI